MRCFDNLRIARAAGGIDHEFDERGAFDLRYAKGERIDGENDFERPGHAIAVFVLGKAWISGEPLHVAHLVGHVQDGAEGERERLSGFLEFEDFGRLPFAGSRGGGKAFAGQGDAVAGKGKWREEIHAGEVEGRGGVAAVGGEFEPAEAELDFLGFRSGANEG